MPSEFIFDPVLGYGLPRLTHPTYHQICGGFIIDLDTIVSWGSRLADCQCDPKNLLDVDYAKQVVQDEVEKHKPLQLLRFNNTSDWLDYGLLILTQRKYSKEPLDTANLPQFERGGKEKVAEELLRKHNIERYEFRTVFR